MGAVDWGGLVTPVMVLCSGVLAQGLAAMRWAANMESRVAALEKKGGPL
jgi:hypothetical protein